MITMHTPGPWSARVPAASEQPHWKVVGPGNQHVAMVHIMAHNPAEADVRLIAAAPDLLAALKGIMTLHEPEGRFQPHSFKPFLKAAVAAIAKAEGRA